MKKTITNLFLILTTIISVLIVLIYKITDWFDLTFGVTFDKIFYYLNAPLEGTNTNFVGTALLYIAPALLAVIGSIVAYWLFEKKILSRVSVDLSFTVIAKKIKVGLKPVLRVVIMVMLLLLLRSSFKYLDDKVKIMDFYEAKHTETHIYETEYVFPDSVKIEAPEKKKNLLYIYVESLEGTYASIEDGGKEEINYIPKLTKVANENVSFSDNDKLGGFRTTQDTGWTVAGIFATSSGAPLSFPIEENATLSYHNFAAGIDTIGDILQQNGYKQEFLCGSDANFGARTAFFKVHGDFDIFDYYTAIDKGYIAPDYKVWWGYEDKILYQIAKDELLRLSSEGEPFNLTMLTADTHFLDGYVCDLCPHTYPEKAANVVACADNQLTDFLEWCSEQSFFEDTVIVITGDHPRMDTSLMDGISDEERTVYNCFINSAKKPVKEKNRIFTHMDIFPTTLSAMGFEIEGSRLGLGTDLFSEKETMAEQMGFDELDHEISKYSTYYIEKFTKEE